MARHHLLHLDEISKTWHQKDWETLAAVVEYAQEGIPTEMSKTDPYMYRGLCAALAEYHIRGYDRFNLPLIKRLARRSKLTKRVHGRKTAMENMVYLETIMPPARRKKAADEYSRGSKKKR